MIEKTTKIFVPAMQEIAKNPLLPQLIFRKRGGIILFEGCFCMGKLKNKTGGLCT